MTEVNVREGEEIQYGDLVTLFVQDGDDTDTGGFLSAEGMLNEDCIIAPGSFEVPPTDLHSCVFRVMPMYQYYAQTEFDDHFEKTKEEQDKKNLPKDLTQKGFKRTVETAFERANKDAETDRTTDVLTEALDKERQLNLMTAQRIFGKTLCYGQTAMLLHYKSQKILTMYPQQVATHETSCLKVQLNETGRLTSALMFHPRYRIHKKGDSIESMHKMKIEFAKQDKQMLYANISCEEVSASTTASTWKICRYSPYHPHEADYVNISQMIRLYQPNSQSYAASNGRQIYLEKAQGIHVMPICNLLVSFDPIFEPVDDMQFYSCDSLIHILLRNIYPI